MSESIDPRRRALVRAIAALGIASFAQRSSQAREEAPPEIRRIRLVRASALCLAPQYIAQALLKAEGFTDVEYVEITGGNVVDGIHRGDADLTMDAAPAILYGVDQGKSLVALAGIHAGCYELFGNARVKTVRDLKGRTVSVYALGGADHILLASMAAYVGLDPQRDIRWITGDRTLDALELFASNQADAFMGFPPTPQQLRARGIGHVIVNTAQDRPWSQYFCCMVVGNRGFVGRYPMATRRALRALLKATDICSQQPARAATLMVDEGFEPSRDMALDVLTSIPYRRWREATSEDTLRFLALRLHEAGMIRSDPNQLVARAGDWRHLYALREEMKL